MADLNKAHEFKVIAKVDFLLSGNWRRTCNMYRNCNSLSSIMCDIMPVKLLNQCYCLLGMIICHLYVLDDFLHFDKAI